MPTYRRRFPEVDAYFWRGEVGENIPDWVIEETVPRDNQGGLRFFDTEMTRAVPPRNGPDIVFALHLLLGGHHALPGTWILRDGNGVWLMAADVFQAMYEEVR